MEFTIVGQLNFPLFRCLIKQWVAVLLFHLWSKNMCYALNQRRRYQLSYCGSEKHTVCKEGLAPEATTERVLLDFN